MLHVISSQTKFNEEDIIQSFRRVYKRHGSLEYRFSVQELDILSNDEDIDLEKIKHAAIVAFSMSRNLRLQPYNGVLDILRWLHKTGYCLVAYTDAPHQHSINRLSKLGIRKFFDMLVAWGPTSDDNGLIYSESDRNDLWYSRDDDKIFKKGKLLVWTHSASEKKPNRALLKRLLEELNANPEGSWAIGDSVEKDLQPAKELGLKGVWARYGKDFEKKNWGTLVSISPWEASTIKTEEASSFSIQPDFVVDEIAEIRKIIPAIQQSLFDR